MKDPVHHRKNVQKQVIRSSRRQPTNSVIYPSSPLVLLHSEAHPAAAKHINHDLRLDNDSKRKMPLDFIRRTGQYPGQRKQAMY